jgi:hypothetical protein
MVIALGMVCWLLSDDVGPGARADRRCASQAHRILQQASEARAELSGQHAQPPT